MLFRIFAIGCVLVSGFAFGKQGAPKSVSLILNWKPEPEFGGFYQADLEGLYSKAGLQVKILPGGVGTPSVQMVAAGKAEFGIVSADEAVISRERGTDIVALFAVYQTSPMGIMVHESSGVKSLADLFASPRTLALERGLSAAKFLEQKYGFQKVKVVPFTGGVSQFLADPQFAQQCFVTAEPLLAKRQGARPRVFLISDSGFNPYNTVLVTRGELLKKNPELVRGMVEATRKGWLSYMKDPKRANAKMHELNPTMDAQTFTECAEAQTVLIENDKIKGAKIGTMEARRWEELVQQLVRMGMVSKGAPAAEYFRNF